MTKERLVAAVCIDPAGQYIDACSAFATGRGERLKLRNARHCRVAVAPELLDRVNIAAQPRRFNVREALLLDDSVGEAMGRTLDEHLGDHPSRGDAIVGVEGIYICPDEQAMGLELGSPARVAQIANVRAVGNFSRSDYSVGGSGGAVRSWANWLMLRDRRLSRVGVDISAVVELTFVPAGSPSADVVSMYTGGGLSIINALARKLFNKPADVEGSIASAGSVCKMMLNELLANPYFLKPAPKITSPHSWGDVYAERLLLIAERLDCAKRDIMATAAELVARSVSQAVLNLTERPHQVVLWGEGALNIHLASRIRSLLSPSSTITCEKFDIGILARRAHALCAMAMARVQAVPIYCPHATGARQPVLSGAIYDPPRL